MKTKESRSGRLVDNESIPGKDMKKNRMFNTALIFVAFVLTCGFIAFGAHFNGGESLQGIAIGYPSNVSILAPREVEDTLATEENRIRAMELAEELPRIYMLNPVVWPSVEHNLEFFSESLSGVREYHAQEIEAFEHAQREATSDFRVEEIRFDEELAAWEALRDSIAAIDGDMSELPAPPEEPTEPEPLEPDFQVGLQFELLPVSFNEAQQELILSLGDYAYAELWTIIMTVAESVQATNIYVADSASTLNTVDHYLGEYALDNDTRTTIEAILSRHITANRIENEEATQQSRDLMAQNYVRELILEGQTIVTIGDIVTPNIYAILEQLGLLGETTLRDLVIPISGAIFIVLLLFMACMMYLYYYRPTVAAIKREAFLLFTLYVLVLTFVFVLRDFSYPFLPILLFPMLVSVLMERRSAILLSFALTMISYFVVAGSWDFLVFFFIAGLVISMLSRFTTDRNKIFIVATGVLVIQFILATSISAMTDHNNTFYSIPALLTTAGIAGLNGLLTVIISTGSLPIWETFFGVVTPVKLLDLTNPTNILLRRLTIEAPGTYHHSLIVANLAETAAYDIGANAHAARVGGYYHDIGKLKYPHYFAENIDGENPHDHFDPSDSARIIISHVSYGLTLAAEHRLPQFVRDIIQEHHGTSLLQFFFHKAKESGEAVDEKDYRYPYIIPQTRESACVSLADLVEAAMRAKMPKLKSAEEVESSIKELIRRKLHDGQLADSQLSIKDVAVIEQSFIRVLKGMYHERIQYPKPVPIGDAESVISAKSEE
ncbi:MAG: HDIG domain-containing protein [Defluviitaleaceae bacterium]|nr:HDIG domain-containing protein [Defluviitaleaceae bacterium]